MAQPKIIVDQLDATTVADARAVNSAYLFGHNFATTTGLTFGYYGGTILVNGVLTTIANATVVLTLSTTNFVEVNLTGVVSANVVGFTAGSTPMYTLVTSASAITTITDNRTFNRPQGGVLTKSIAGGTSVTLTAAEARNQIFIFTGIISASINVVVPVVAAILEIHNNTTGLFTVNIKTPAGTGTIVAQGRRTLLYCDGVNVVRSITEDNSFDGVSGWDDLFGPLAFAKTIGGASEPAWAVFTGELYSRSFSATALQELWVAFHIPHTYVPGTVIHPHIHWATNGINTGVVRWGIEYSAAKAYSQQIFPLSTTIFIEQAAVGVARTHQIAEGATIPATNLEPDTMILCRIFRDAAHVNDTCTDPAFGFECDLHYQCTTNTTKNRNFPFS